MKTILIVDDDHHVLSCLQDMMLQFGHRVIAKQDGRSALAVIGQGEAVDLVITDYQIPGMDGLELVAGMKQTAPSIPVIMFSAAPRADVYLKARALGVVEFVEKPAKPQVIRRIVENALMQPARSGIGLVLPGGAEEDSAALQSSGGSI